MRFCWILQLICVEEISVHCFKTQFFCIKAKILVNQNNQCYHSYKFQKKKKKNWKNKYFKSHSKIFLHEIFIGIIHFTGVNLMNPSVTGNFLLIFRNSCGELRWKYTLKSVFLYSFFHYDAKDWNRWSKNMLFLISSILFLFFMSNISMRIRGFSD